MKRRTILKLASFLAGASFVTPELLRTALAQAPTGSDLRWDGPTYFVDPAEGRDDARGTSPGSAWRSVGRALDRLEPGSRVLFRRGQVFREPLVPTRSGTADRPILFGAYGDGDPPLFTGSVELSGAPWKQVRNGIWATAVERDGGEAPEKLFLDGKLAGIVAADPAALNGPGDWAWSDGTLYLRSPSDPNRAYRSIEVQVRRYGALLRDVAHLHLADLAFIRSRDGIALEQARNCTILACRSAEHARNGFLVGKGSTGCRIGRSHAAWNGTDGRGRSDNHLGHGILFTSGAHHNTVEDVVSEHNAEDGIQWSPDAGDRNDALRTVLRYNREDGVDQKGGRQALSECRIYGNERNAVLVHEKAHSLALSDGVYETVAKSSPLAVTAGFVTSRRNTYRGKLSFTVSLVDKAGPCDFAADLFIDGGEKSTLSVNIAGTRGHRFTHCTFIMRNKGDAVRLRKGADDVTFVNCVFATERARCLRLEDGARVQLDSVLCHRADQERDWIVVQGGTDYGLPEIAAGKVPLGGRLLAADPRFADPERDDFTLTAGSPALGRGRTVPEVEIDNRRRPFGTPPSLGALSGAGTGR